MCYFVFYTYKKLYYYFFPTFTTIHTTNIITTNSFSLRLFNSFITDFSLEDEHTTDFTSVLGKTLNTNSTDSCNCSNLAYLIDGIVVTCLVINNYLEHLPKKLILLFIILILYIILQTFLVFYFVVLLLLLVLLI